MSDKALTWQYVEDYIPENEILRNAREAAIELGASPVSPGIGQALRAITAMCGARAVLEIGTGAGVSGLWMLDGMPADGVLTSIDHEVEFQREARKAFQAAGVPTQRTRLIAGRALDVLPRMAARGYDLVVIDADVTQSPDYLDHAVRVLRPGGVVIVVHALWHDQVADPARRDADTVVMREIVQFLAKSADFVPALFPVGDGLAVAIKR